jgi:hypothetical protein
MDDGRLAGVITFAVAAVLVGVIAAVLLYALISSA